MSKVEALKAAKKYITIGFNKLSKIEKDDVIKSMEKLKDFAGKTKKEIRDVLKKVYKKDVTPPAKLKKIQANKDRPRKPLFDLTDRMRGRKREANMVNRVTPKQQPTAKDFTSEGINTQLLKLQDEAGDGMNIVKRKVGGTLRSTRGYGKARTPNN
jgi:hypothetical protein